MIVVLDGQSMETRVAERSTMNPKIESDEKVVPLHSSALFEKLASKINPVYKFRSMKIISEGVNHF